MRTARIVSENKVFSVDFDDIVTDKGVVILYKDSDMVAIIPQGFLILLGESSESEVKPTNDSNHPTEQEVINFFKIDTIIDTMIPQSKKEEVAIFYYNRVKSHGWTQVVNGSQIKIADWKAHARNSCRWMKDNFKVVENASGIKF